jgi:hypothetical protein
MRPQLYFLSADQLLGPGPIVTRNAGRHLGKNYDPPRYGVR